MPLVPWVTVALFHTRESYFGKYHRRSAKRQPQRAIAGNVPIFFLQRIRSSGSRKIRKRWTSRRQPLLRMDRRSGVLRKILRTNWMVPFGSYCSPISAHVNNSPVPEVRFKLLRHSQKISRNGTRERSRWVGRVHQSFMANLFYAITAYLLLL